MSVCVSVTVNKSRPAAAAAAVSDAVLHSCFSPCPLTAVENLLAECPSARQLLGF